MKRFYYYLFFKLYFLFENLPSKWWSDWKAVLTITILELWIVASLLIYYNVFINKFFELSKVMIITPAFLLAGINYFIFIQQQEWRAFFGEFNGLSKKRNRIGSLVVFLIISIIVLNLIFSLHLMSQIDWKKYR